MVGNNIEVESPIVYGRFDANRKQLNGMKILSSGKNDPMASVYPSNSGIRQKTIQQLVVAAWEQYHTEIVDLIPNHIKTQFIDYLTVLRWSMTCIFQKT